MKGYRLLSDIREEFKVSYQTLDKHLAKLNIAKKTDNRRVYIKNAEYDILYKSLSNSNRVKKIAEIDFSEFQEESHKEELLKKDIKYLSKRIEDLEKEIEFKNNEIENFHGVIGANSLKIDGLERQIKLLEEAKDIEIKTITTELNNMTETKRELELSISELNITIQNKEKDLGNKDLEIQTIAEQLDNTIKSKDKLELSINALNEDNEKLKNEIIEERAAKEIIIAENNKYKNMSFADRFKFLLFNK